MNKYTFCNKCHRKLVLPIKGNINISGKINLSCPCGGKGIIKGESQKKEEMIEETVNKNYYEHNPRHHEYD